MSPPLPGPARAQTTLIGCIDEISDSEARKVASPPRRMAVVTRLVILPLWTFALALVRHGALLQGVRGLKSAGNEAALSLATEAKIYERFFSDNTSLARRHHDFLDEGQ